MSLASGASRTFSFLLVDKFGMFSFAAAIDAIRIANRIAGVPFYKWHTVTVDGGLVRGSNGIELKPDHSISTLPQSDVLFVWASSLNDPPDQPQTVPPLSSDSRMWNVPAMFSRLTANATLAQAARRQST